MPDAERGHDAGSIERELREAYEARFGPPRTELIEAGRVRDYLLAMDEPLDRADDDPIPPLFLLTLARTRRPQPSRGTSVNAGDDYQFRLPVRVGDRITVTRQVTEVAEKQGKRGPMYLIRSESTFTNQSGELVAVSRQSILRWGQ